MSEERYPMSRVEQWSARLNRMPRMLRMVLSLAITLEMVVLAWLLIATILDIELFDPNQDLTVPMVLVTVLGLVFYGVGWWAMVGFDTAPWQAGTPAVIYTVAGCAGLFLVLMLVLLGLAFGYIL